MLTETNKALTSQTSSEATAVALLRTQYLKDNIIEPHPVTFYSLAAPDSPICSSKPQLLSHWTIASRQNTGFLRQLRIAGLRCVG
jgi:hypothetical protein